MNAEPPITRSIKSAQQPIERILFACGTHWGLPNRLTNWFSAVRIPLRSSCSL